MSTGAALGLEFAVKRPPGLLGLVLGSGYPSMKSLIASTHRRRLELPIDMQAAINAAENAQVFGGEAWEEAILTYVQRYMIRVDPLPDAVKKELANPPPPNPVFRAM